MFLLALAAISFAARVLTGTDITWHKGDIWVITAYAAWAFAYFAYSWAASGGTAGMALVGVRVVRDDGTGAERAPRGRAHAGVPAELPVPGTGVHRHLAGDRRRALHDVIAGTAVIYSWDARAARLVLVPGLIPAAIPGCRHWHPAWRAHLSTHLTRAHGDVSYRRTRAPPRWPGVAEDHGGPSAGQPGDRACARAAGSCPPGVPAGLSLLLDRDPDAFRPYLARRDTDLEDPLWYRAVTSLASTLAGSLTSRVSEP